MVTGNRKSQRRKTRLLLRRLFLLRLLFPGGLRVAFRRSGDFGFWFDGIRGEATLYVDNRTAACTVEYAV
jgi:hypothetical protein